MLRSKFELLEKIKMKTIWGLKKFEIKSYPMRFFQKCMILRREKLVFLQKKSWKKVLLKLWNLNKPANNCFFSLLWESCDLSKVWSWKKIFKKSYIFLFSHLLDSSNKIFIFQWRSSWQNFQLYQLSDFPGRNNLFSKGIFNEKWKKLRFSKTCYFSWKENIGKAAG